MKKDMNYLKDVFKECEIMAIEANIPIGIISDIKINTRAKQRWGLCTLLPDHSFKIEISSRLLEDNVSKEALIDTVMHEILHTVEGCMNHGKTWKLYAKIVNEKYGLNIKRCTSSAEKHIEPSIDEYNYIIACPKCGYQWKYIRLTNAVKYPNRYHHTGCSTENLIRIK